MDPSSTVLSPLGDTFEKQLDGAYKKVIDQHWSLLSTYEDHGICLFRVLKTKHHMNELKSILSFHYSNSWYWSYFLEHSVGFKDLVKKYDHREHILLAIDLPQGYSDNVLGMTHVKVRMFERSSKKEIL